MTCENEYALPTIKFIGGATRTFTFNLYYKDGTPMAIDSGSVADFSVTGYATRGGSGFLSKEMDISPDGDYVTVSLSGSDTVNRNGKYIYQIQIKKSISGGGIDTIGPFQGIMYIEQNINKSFIPAN